MSVDSSEKKEEYLNFDFQQNVTPKTTRKFNGKKFLFYFIGFSGIVMFLVSFFMEEGAAVEQSNPVVSAEMSTQEEESSIKIIQPVYSEKMDGVDEPVTPDKDQVTSTQENGKVKEEKTLKVDDANGQNNKSKTESKEVKKIATKDNDVKEVSHKYYLIAGSFGSEVNARSLVSQLQSSGYWALNLGKMGATYKVSIGSYETKSEADIARSQLLSKGIDTWVLHE